MLIGEAAAIAGTTFRAVRHYHRLGLLAEPARKANGYRHYELADVVRLLRIRWLASSGLPLGAVSAVLDSDDTDDVAADLDDLLTRLDAQIAELTERRNRLADMRDAHRAGARLTPLPQPLADALDEIAAGEQDPAVRDLVARERTAWEMLALTGNAPPGLLDAAAGILADPAARARLIAVFRRFAALSAAGVTADEAGAVGEELATLLAAVLPEQSVGDAGDDTILRLLVPDAGQRAAAQHALTALRGDA